MPITINWPPTPVRIGPGVDFIVRTDLIGPVPSTAMWDLNFQHTTSEESIWHTIMPDAGKAAGGIWGIPVDDPIHNSIKPMVQAEQPMTLIATLSDPSIGTIDSSTIPAGVFDPISMAWRYQAQLQTQVQGGFTIDDRTLITQTHASVQGTLQATEGAVPQIAQTVFDLISKPPNVLLCRREGFPVSGVRTLTRTGLVGPVSAYGASLDFSILPERLGLEQGVNDITFSRLAQVMLIRTNACGDEYVAELHDIRERHHDLFWQDPITLKRIEVSVLPGVTCGWTWYGLLGA